MIYTDKTHTIDPVTGETVVLKGKEMDTQKLDESIRNMKPEDLQILKQRIDAVSKPKGITIPTMQGSDDKVSIGKALQAIYRLQKGDRHALDEL